MNKNFPKYLKTCNWLSLFKNNNLLYTAGSTCCLKNSTFIWYDIAVLSNQIVNCWLCTNMYGLESYSNFVNCAVVSSVFIYKPTYHCKNRGVVRIPLRQLKFLLRPNNENETSTCRRIIFISNLREYKTNTGS